MSVTTKVLGREVNAALCDFTLPFKGTVLITGANGSIGSVISERINADKIVLTDIDSMDVTNEERVRIMLDIHRPDLIIHLAGAKHAPEGEVNVMETVNINTIGTYNLLKWMPATCKLVLSSTCKSCNPETVYGASKLIAERMVLNSGNVVARFYNVIETQGNVFEIWEQQKEKQVAVSCERYFITLDEAIGLILFSCTMQQGRYTVNAGDIRKMTDMFKSIYGEEKFIPINPRRGDRVSEKLHSESEYVYRKLLVGNVIQIKNYHD